MDNAVSMDDLPDHTRQVLLVSSDSFIEGLVRGCCQAHCLELEVQRFASTLLGEAADTPPLLLIVDGRSSGQPNGERETLRPETVVALRTHARAPLCLISDADDLLSRQCLGEQDAVIGEPLAESIDHCLRRHATEILDEPAERRRRQRRAWQDRRKREDRRRGVLTSRRALNGQFQRPGHRRPRPDNYRVGPFTIDPASREVTMNSVDLHLSTKEFLLFHLMAINAGEVLAADRIIDEVWPDNSRANKSDLYQYVHLLRRKIERDPQCPHWLVTVKGVGYRLDANPTG
jgi:DNA-binding response OmpR family regulator